MPMTIPAMDRRLLIGAGVLLPLVAPSASGQAPDPRTGCMAVEGTLDGEPVTAADLRPMALINYGHFSTMRVRRRAVQGLDFQLARLQRSTQKLFGTDLAGDLVRRYVREAVPDDAQTYLVRINIFPRNLSWMNLNAPAKPVVLVTKSLLPAVPGQPQAVQSVQYERDMPDIKHVGTFGLFHHRRRAQGNGFDDALFFDSKRSVSEGSTWNVGFYDGTRVVLPTAAALPGGAVHLLRQGMRMQGVPFLERDVKVDEVGRFELAFSTNVPETIRPLRKIDAAAFPVTHTMYERLQACYDANEWTTL